MSKKQEPTLLPAYDAPGGLQHTSPDIRREATGLAKRQGEEMTSERKELQYITPLPQNPMALMQACIEKGINKENVEVFGKLLEYQERMEDRDAEKQFAAAFVALQAAMPKVQATRAVPNNDGTIRYHYAAFEDIMAQVGPFLKAHGFAVTFSMKPSENRIMSSCTLIHVGGHSKTNEFSVRAGKGPPGSSEAQGDGSASTYAKRFALGNALNIVTEGMDDDARNEGGTITQDQAEDLKQRVESLKLAPAQVTSFIKWGGGTSFYTIPEAKYQMLKDFLTKKENEQVPY